MRLKTKDPVEGGLLPYLVFHYRVYRPLATPVCVLHIKPSPALVHAGL